MTLNYPVGGHTLKRLAYLHWLLALSNFKEWPSPNLFWMIWPGYPQYVLRSTYYGPFAL